MALNSLRMHGRFIGFGIICGLVLAVLITLKQKPVWQAEMVVGATERTGVLSFSSLLPQGAADAPALQLFADRIDAATSTDFTRFETILNSPQIVNELAQKNIASYNNAAKPIVLFPVLAFVGAFLGLMLSGIYKAVKS